MNLEELREYCLSLPHVTEDMPFGEDILVFRICNRIFVLTSLESVPLRESLKCDPARAIELREQYPDKIIAGYHLNKKFWNTLLVDQHLPPKLLRSLIRHSWNEASAKLTKRVRTELGITPLPEED